MTPAESPAEVSTALPLEQLDENPQLRGRDAILAELNDPGERVWVLHGLGGCGKTRLAQEVAVRAQQRSREVWWVSAGESGNLVAGMRAVGRHLHIPDAALNQGDAADVIWQGLANRPEQEIWLLVIDGVDDPKILAGPGKSVAEGRGWLRPVRTKTGMVLVTSRDGSQNSWAHQWCRRLHVKMLPTDEAGEVLADYAGRSPRLGDGDDARRLADRLGGLPLALQLAGRNLFKAAGWSAKFADVPRTYRQYLDAIEDEAPRPPGGEMTQRRALEMVGYTSDRTLDLLDKRGVPEARPMLQLLASFGPAPIPWELVLDTELLAACPPFLGISGLGILGALEALTDFDLIDMDPSGEDPNQIGEARLHPLVRDTSRPPAGSAERAMFLNLAAQLLEPAAAPEQAGRPEDPKRWQLWRLLAPHPGHVLDALEREPGYPADGAAAAAFAAHRAARYHAARGLHEQAEAQFRKVLTVRSRVLGAEHADTLATRHEIARMTRLRGRYAEAETEFRDVLAARRRVLAADDRYTLITWHEIAVTMAAQREYAKAETEFRNVLEARTGLLGADHPDTLITWHEIARMMAEQGKYTEAEIEFRKVLEAKTGKLGGEDRDTLITRHEIARVMADQRKYTEAEKESREVLVISERVLGDEHPDTLITRHEIARVMALQGKYAEAEAEFRKVLEARTRTLGADYPDTLITRHEMARVMADQRKYTEAEAEFRDVLEARKRVLGDDHPETLATQYQIARMMEFRADYAGAEAAYREIVAIGQRVRDADHPETLIVRHEVARMMAEQGYLARAEAEFRGVLEARTRHPGADHPATLITRHEVARMMAEQGNRADAEAEFRNVLQARAHRLGTDHPDTLITRHEIARLMADRGDYAGAEAESREIRDVSLAALGADHPVTLIARHEFARVLAEQGDRAGAEAEFRDVLEARTRLLGADHPDTLITGDALNRLTAER